MIHIRFRSKTGYEINVNSITDLQWYSDMKTNKKEEKKKKKTFTTGFFK